MCCTHIDMAPACSTNLLLITTDAETTAACCSSDLRVLRCRIERVGYVRECCKGDDESQWERVKFDAPPPKNPLTDGHQNLRT